MKRFIKIALFCCLICCAFAICGCGKSDKKSSINWDGLTIANFDSYSYMGVSATQETPTAKNMSLSKATRLARPLADSNGVSADELIKDSAPEEPVKLVGITDAGKCEEMQFVNKKGDVSKQNAHLIRLDTYNRYSFAIFSTQSSEYIDTSWGVEHDEMEYSFSHQDIEIVYRLKGSWLGSDRFLGDQVEQYFFIIDNNNGNIYSMNDIRDRFIKKTGETKFRRINFLSDSLYRDFIMFELETHDGTNLYQIKFSETDIEIIERMNDTQLKNFLGGVSEPEYLTFDHFGNIFRTRKYNGTSWEYELTPKNGSRYQRSDGIFDTLNFTDERYPGNDYMAEYTFFNHFLIRRTYAEPQSNLNLETVSYLNGEGEFVPVRIDLPNIWGDLDTMYHEGNVYYHVDRDSLTVGDGSYRQTMTLTKITLSEENGWDCTVEKILLEDEWVYDYIEYDRLGARNSALVTNHTFGNVYMYSYYNNDFYIYNLETGEKTIINNYEQIKKVYYDEKLSVVKAIFIDSRSMEDVTGYFTLNNELVVEQLNNIYYGNRKVFVIKPLNR